MVVPVKFIARKLATAGTICGAAELCRQRGANAIYVGATHAVLCGAAVQRLRDAPIDEIIVTDTVRVPQEKIDGIGKIKVLSVAPLLGEAIHRIHTGLSIGAMFE